MITIVAVEAVASYTAKTYLPTYLISTIGLSTTTALLSTSVTLVFAACLIPFYAILSDRIGRKPLLIWGTVALIVVAIPAFLLIGTGTIAGAIGGQILAIIPGTAISTAVVVTQAELFPTRVRYTGAALGYNSAYALFGGTAPFVAAALIAATGSKLMPAFYLVVIGVIGLIVMTRLPETSKRNMDDAVRPLDPGLLPDRDSLSCNTFDNPDQTEESRQTGLPHQQRVEPVTSTRFADRVVIATGTASGLGLATVRQFAEEGAHPRPRRPRRTGPSRTSSPHWSAPAPRPSRSVGDVSRAATATQAVQTSLDEVRPGRRAVQQRRHRPAGGHHTGGDQRGAMGCSDRREREVRVSVCKRSDPSHDCQRRRGHREHRVLRRHEGVSPRSGLWHLQSRGHRPDPGAGPRLHADGHSDQRDLPGIPRMHHHRPARHHDR